MFNTFSSVFAPAVMERVTLVVNHVIGAEALARARLQPHAGRTLALTLVGWPTLLPAPPACVFRISPAGLLEWMGGESGNDSPTTPDLALRIEAANPAALLAKAALGQMPAVAVDGDAQLAGDVNWLLQNLRWDVAAELERLFGPIVAQQLHTLGSALAAALRRALAGAGTLRERLRPGP